MVKFEVSATRAPDLDSAEVRRRLARVYRIVLEAGGRPKVQDTAQPAVSRELAAGDPTTDDDSNPGPE
jgi:hypothetical protein